MKTAIILGRFQNYTMHTGYVKLLEHAKQNYENVVIILGKSPRSATKSDPLPVALRKELVKNYCESNDIKATIYSIPDEKTDVPWVNKLDNFIEFLDLGSKDFNFLVGRDSFRSYYEPIGKYPSNFDEVETFVDAQGEDNSTFFREKIKNFDFEKEANNAFPRSFEDMAKGIIWATQNQYDRIDTTVDIAPIKIIDGIANIILGRKPKEQAFRLPGGYLEKSDGSAKTAACRELHEETGIIAYDKDLVYLDTVVVNDWRYRKGNDTILTTLFLIEMDSLKNPEWIDKSNNTCAADDICELITVPLVDINSVAIVPEHKHLIGLVLSYYNIFPNVKN